MRRALATACSTVIGLLAVTPAAPAADTPIPPADHAQIGVLVDHFVKDVVKRHDLAAGRLLAGHDVRAGTTRAAWVRGIGVSVPSLPPGDRISATPGRARSSRPITRSWR